MSLTEDTNTMAGPGTTSGLSGGQGGVGDSHSLCLWPLQRAGASTQPGCASAKPLLLLGPLSSPFGWRKAFPASALAGTTHRSEKFHLTKRLQHVL